VTRANRLLISSVRVDTAIIDERAPDEGLTSSGDAHVVGHWLDGPLPTWGGADGGYNTYADNVIVTAVPEWRSPSRLAVGESAQFRRCRRVV
jgi:hypothetical protein